MKRKIFTVLIAILLAVTSFSMVQASGEVTATLRASSSKVKSGETFTVTLSATCDEGINGIDTTYTYDETILELQSAGVADSSKWSSLGSGRSITLISNTESKITSASLYTLTFKVKETATIGEKASVQTTQILLDSDAASNSNKTITARTVTIEIAGETTGEGDSSTGEGTTQTPPEDNNQEPTPPQDDDQEPTPPADNTPQDDGKEQNQQGTSKPATTPKKDTTTTKNSNLPKTGRSTTLTIMLIIEAIIVLMFVGLFFGYKSFVKKKYKQ